MFDIYKMMNEIDDDASLGINRSTKLAESFDRCCEEEEELDDLVNEGTFGKKDETIEEISEGAFDGGYAEGGSLDTYKRAGGAKKNWKDALEGKKTKTVKAKDLEPGMITSTGKVTQVTSLGWVNGKPSVEVAYGGIGAQGSHASDVVAADRDYEVLDEGIFDSKRKKQADLHNGELAFNQELKKIASLDTNGLARKLSKTFVDTVNGIPHALKERGKPTTSTFLTYEKNVRQAIPALLKELKKPQNIQSPFRAVERALTSCARGAMDDSALKELKNIFFEANKIQADDKVKKEVTRKIAHQVSYDAENLLNMIKKKQGSYFSRFGEAVEPEEDDKQINESITDKDAE